MGGHFQAVHSWLVLGRTSSRPHRAEWLLCCGCPSSQIFFQVAQRGKEQLHQRHLLGCFPTQLSGGGKGAPMKHSGTSLVWVRTEKHPQPVPKMGSDKQESVTVASWARGGIVLHCAGVALLGAVLGTTIAGQNY